MADKLNILGGILVIEDLSERIKDKYSK